MKIRINIIHLYTVGFSIAALLLIVFLIYPTLKDIKQDSNKILENKSELVFADEQAKAIEEFNNNYNEYEPGLKKIDQVLLDPKNLIDLIKFFESSGNESSVAVSVNLLESGKKESLSGLPSTLFNLTVEGTFSNVLIFSEKLEKGPYMVKIKSLSMNTSSQNNQDKTIDAQFSILVATKYEN